MIFLITDFGMQGPYLGQMEVVLRKSAPQIPLIHLLSDAPSFDPFHTAYLIAAYTQQATAGDVILGVVDPGVGSDRAGIVLKADSIWYVGPDNGLFEIVALRARERLWWALDLPQDPTSHTFHGRDLFAPVAGWLAAGHWEPSGPPSSHPPSGGHGLDPSCAEVVYIDHYGNVMTGLSGASVPPDGSLELGGHSLTRARTFSEVPAGSLFWYINANGLVEVAANQGRACDRFGAYIGMPVMMRE